MKKVLIYLSAFIVFFVTVIRLMQCSFSTGRSHSTISPDGKYEAYETLMSKKKFFGGYEYYYEFAVGDVKKASQPLKTITLQPLFLKGGDESVKLDLDSWDVYWAQDSRSVQFISSDKPLGTELKINVKI